MAKDWSGQLKLVNFKCKCRHTFSAVPDLIEDDPDAPHHPYRYLAHCPACKAEHQPQISWERGLLKAHQTSTGPVTAEGKAASAANLDGHPTSEEARRTRFNAMKHGMAARTATYFPAKPDGYAFCGKCDVGRDWCAAQPACVKQTEIFMLHHAAFDQRNPKVLTSLHADVHSALMATLQMCLQAVLSEGVLIKQPRVELDREGNSVTLAYIGEDGKKKYIYDFTSNPAFKPIADLVTRMGLSMNDLGMSVRGFEDAEDAGKGMGVLRLDEKSKETLDAFGVRMLEASKNAADLIKQSQADLVRDPVYIQHQAQEKSR
ncbi:MAG: hypothetical protein Q7K57_61495 [Burkholderiaceae bacterium]|nr:hypothetical protein [Burkholderiaceae bacterium]